MQPFETQLLRCRADEVRNQSFELIKPHHRTLDRITYTPSAPSRTHAEQVRLYLSRQESLSGVVLRGSLELFSASPEGPIGKRRLRLPLRNVRLDVFTTFRKIELHYFSMSIILLSLHFYSKDWEAKITLLQTLCPERPLWNINILHLISRRRLFLPSTIPFIDVLRAR